MRWARILVVIGILGVLIVGAGTAWVYHALWGSRSQRPVSLEVQAGANTRQVLDELHDHDLIPSTRAARFYLRLRADGRHLHFGTYAFDEGLRPVDVLEIVLEGSVEMFQVTVVEGEMAVELSDRFIAHGVGDTADWQSLFSKVEWVATIAPDAPSLEGFFFPDTYRFAVGIDAQTAAKHLVQRLLTVWREESAAVESLWGTPQEILTLASLIEAETSLANERPTIAGVFVNRLRRGMLLQCDPTVVYALKRRNQWQGRLLRVHLDVDDPYNTYRYPGLPPGPINSPGRAAIAAALAPEKTSFLYFVARAGGGHQFSRTLAEHNRAVAQLRASRR